MAISQSGRQIVNAGVKISLGDYGDVSLTKGQPPIMVQIAGIDGKPPKEFQFPFRPLPIQFEGFGLELSEIERPYDVPIVNVKSGKLRRFNFDAPLSMFDDGIQDDLESKEVVLRQMADDGIPVRFLKMPPAVTNLNWYITELGITTDRTTVAGAVVRVSASMSFTEFEASKAKFIFLSPISYGVPTGNTPATVGNAVTGSGAGWDKILEEETRKKRTEAGLEGRQAPDGTP